MNEEFINFSEILDVLKKRWLIILCVTLIAGGGAAIGTNLLIPKTYASTTKLFVGKEPSGSSDQSTNNTPNDLLMYQKLMKTYVEIMTSRDVAEATVNALVSEDGVRSVSVSAVRGGLTVSPGGDSQIITVTYKNTDPSVTRIVLEQVINQFKETSGVLIPTSNIQTIERAVDPVVPIGPDVTKNAAKGAAAGFGISIVLSFLAEFMNTTFRTKEETERQLELPVLGVIPKEEQSSRRRGKHNEEEVQHVRRRSRRSGAVHEAAADSAMSKGAPKHSDFVMETDIKSAAAEAYQSLRTNIQYSSFDNEIKTIAVTSTVAGEGKTSIAGNLAMAFANGDTKVILIDCDLRNPQLHKYLKCENYIGLSSVLIGRRSCEDAVQHYNNNLDVLTAGRQIPNPAEMILSKAMTSLIEDLKKQYDFIIFDTAPVATFADTKALSRKVDGVLFSVKERSTKRDAAVRAKKDLENVNCRLIGSVLFASQQEMEGVAKDRQQNDWGEI